MIREGNRWWFFFVLGYSVEVHAELLDLSLEQLLDIPITGVTLIETPIKSTPAAVSVFTKEEIKALPIHNIEELIHFVPGAQAQRSTDLSNHLTFSFRGNSNDISSRQILVLIDGMRIDNPFSGSLTLTYPQIPISHVERVEFIRGPVSAIYGSDAFLGVINIITNSTDNQATATLGSDQHYRASVLHQVETAKIKATLFLEAQNDNGQTYSLPNQFGQGRVESNDPYQAIDAHVNITLLNSTRIQLLYNKRKTDEFYILGSLNNAANQWNSSYSGFSIEQKIIESDTLVSDLKLGYVKSKFDSFVQSPLPPTAPPSTFNPMTNIYVTSDEYWLRQTNNLALNQTQNIQFGFDYQRTATDKAEITLLDNDQHLDALSIYEDADIFGAYTQYQHNVNTSVDIIAGIRYDYHSLSDEQVSPKLGIIYYPTSKNTLKLLYGSAFRAPYRTELYTINNPIATGNENLSSETVDTLEFIWIAQLNDLLITTGFFYNHFGNPIIQDQVNSGPRQYINGGSNSSSGMELEWKAKPTPHLNLNGTAYYLFDKPEGFFGEARTTFSLWGNYRISSLLLGFTFIHQGQKDYQYIDTIKKLPSNNWVNAKLSWELDNQLIPYFEILNIADKEYFTKPNSNLVSEGTPNRGREFRLGFSWEY